jgi:hypothetical protein
MIFIPDPFPVFRTKLSAPFPVIPFVIVWDPLVPMDDSCAVLTNRHFGFLKAKVSGFLPSGQPLGACHGLLRPGYSLSSSLEDRGRKPSKRCPGFLPAFADATLSSCVESLLSRSFGADIRRDDFWLLTVMVTTCSLVLREQPDLCSYHYLVSPGSFTETGAFLEKGHRRDYGVAFFFARGESKFRLSLENSTRGIRNPRPGHCTRTSPVVPFFAPY